MGCIRIYSLMTILLLGLGLLGSTAFAQTWTGKWIWDSSGGPSGKNRWVCFRKTVTLATVPASVTARIAVDSKYWLWINGEMVVFEGGLKRGPNRTDTYYDEVELAKHLRAGSNTIAVLAWYWGRNGFTHNSSGQGGLVFEADLGGGAKIQSESSWKCLKHPAYDSTGALNPNWRYSEFNIKFKAASDIPVWNQPGFDDIGWPQATEKGTPPCAPWNNLVKRPIPHWKDSGLLDYTNKASLPSIGTGDTVKAKLPYNAQITPYLKIDAPAGLTIHIQTDHYVDPGYDDNDRRSLRFEYVTKSGVQEFEFFAWTNGEEVHYKIPAGVKILELKYRETGYNTTFAGSFICNDDFYNQLLQKCRRSTYLGMRDYYMDCPDRERAQWGDFSIYVHQSFYAFDTVSHRLGHKAYSEAMNWQKEDSNLVVPTPNGFLNHNYSLPIQGLYMSGLYGIWNYYLHTGDLPLLQEAYPHLKKFLHLWNIGSDGLIVHRTGSWDWTDWGPNIDSLVLQNVWYYMAVDAASRIAPLVGANADVADYQLRMTSIRNNFDRVYWKSSRYGSGSIIDDRANALAVVAGLADSTKYNAISTILQTVKNASPWMEKFVLEALFKMNRPQEALARMKSRYSQMVSLQSTTLYEHWALVGGSRNHGWSGGPLILMPQFVTGLAPVTTAYATYQVLPQMGDLTSASAAMATVKGQISLSIQKSPGEFAMNLTSPAGTQALVGIPKSASTTLIAVNGRVVYGNGGYIGGVAGLSFAGEDSKYYKFQAAPGAWVFYGGAVPPAIVSHSAITAGLQFSITEGAKGVEISFYLDRECNVELSILDIQGRRIGMPRKGRLTRGLHKTTWLQEGPAAGPYFVCLRAGEQKKVTRRLQLR